MKVRHPIWCLTFILYQKNFYDKIDLKLFYFYLTNKINTTENMKFNI